MCLGSSCPSVNTEPVGGEPCAPLPGWLPSLWGGGVLGFGPSAPVLVSLLDAPVPCQGPCLPSCIALAVSIPRLVSVGQAVGVRCGAAAGVRGCQRAVEIERPSERGWPCGAGKSTVRGGPPLVLGDKEGWPHHVGGQGGPADGAPCSPREGVLPAELLQRVWAAGGTCRPPQDGLLGRRDSGHQQSPAVTRTSFMVREHSRSLTPSMSTSPQ